MNDAQKKAAATNIGAHLIGLRQELELIERDWSECDWSQVEARARVMARWLGRVVEHAQQLGQE